MAAGLIPTLRGNRYRDGGIAASLMSSVGCRQSLRNIVRRIDGRLSWWRGGTVGRDAATRDGFVASRGLCARDRAVFAGVVNDACDDRAGQYFSGVLCQRKFTTRCGECRAGQRLGCVLRQCKLAAGCGESRARKGLSPIFGQCCSISWSCVHECRSGYRACDDGSADDRVVVSRSRVEARECGAWQCVCQCDRRWGLGWSVESVRRCDEACICFSRQGSCQSKCRRS
jgi:hypothetical protein